MDACHLVEAGGDPREGLGPDGRGGRRGRRLGGRRRGRWFGSHWREWRLRGCREWWLWRGRLGLGLQGLGLGGRFRLGWCFGDRLLFLFLF
ncbi:MAG TPA: hypothetical protein VE129_10070, partial [Thermoanaerobaculia bacterium]|nr:hypothetical protein [Thermoanaerobaculia bacterium]